MGANNFAEDDTTLLHEGYIVESLLLESGNVILPPLSPLRQTRHHRDGDEVEAQAAE